MNAHYIGMKAFTITKVCMVGRVRLNGEVLEVFSRLSPIRKGEMVKVVGVYMNQLIVEPTD